MPLEADHTAASSETTRPMPSAPPLADATDWSWSARMGCACSGSAAERSRTWAATVSGSAKIP